MMASYVFLWRMRWNFQDSREIQWILMEVASSCVASTDLLRRARSPSGGLERDSYLCATQQRPASDLMRNLVFDDFGLACGFPMPQLPRGLRYTAQPPKKSHWGINDWYWPNVRPAPSWFTFDLSPHPPRSQNLIMFDFAVFWNFHCILMDFS